MKNRRFWELTNEPSEIDTRYLKGYSLQISFPSQIRDLGPYERDEWAKQYLVDRGLTLNDVTDCFPRDGGQMLVITSFDWKKENL